jgi:hypothetical protein
MGFYMVEPGGKIICTKDVMEWGNWNERVQKRDEQNPHGVPSLEGGCRVAWTDLPNGGFVSTVFLGTEPRVRSRRAGAVRDDDFQGQGVGRTVEVHQP